MLTETITIRDKRIIKEITRLQKKHGDAYPATTARWLLIESLNRNSPPPKLNRRGKRKR